MARPNILFLMSDEHRADVAGYAGNTVIRTPTLDRLARSGCVFTNAYTPSPICIPARQCMMAGQLPKTCGCQGGTDLEPEYMTFARKFTQYGYAATACGKLHHYGQDVMQGWTCRIGSDIRTTHATERIRDDKSTPERNFADYKWLEPKEVNRAGIGRGPHVAMDEYTIRGALDYIDDKYINAFHDRESLTRPLLLKISLLQPHYPYSAEEEKFKFYLNRVQPYLNEMLFDHPFLRQRAVRQGIDSSERELRRATAAYYAMIETVDGHFGTVLKALENAGQNLDEWIIVYTSDHGEMLGQHSIWEKQKFFEGSVKVPLIIRWPKKFPAGGSIDNNVNLCDLFATLCELADIPVPSGLDSRSLIPLMEGNIEDWDNETVSQFGRTNLMIKRDHLKYQYYGENIPEVLFDLQRDPSENTNWIDDPQYSEYVEAFRSRLAELGHGPLADPLYRNAGY